MSISVNGQSCVPPGFRFHPTEEELLNYYLRKKMASQKIDLDVIRDIDLNKIEPWDIQEKCRIGSTPQNDWYFFSHKDKKYPTGTRTNRATAAGFWKATGRDKVIHTSCRRIGMRKTLVFYKGRAPHGQISDWIMHEYRLDDYSDHLDPQSNNTSFLGAEITSQEDGWVVCRVFKKKNLHKAIESSNHCSSSTTDHGKTQLLHSSSEDALEQILQYMGRSCKQEADVSTNSHRSFGVSSIPRVRYLRPIDTVLGAGIQERFMKLPALESPTYPQPPARSYAALPLVDYPCGNQTSYMAETVANFGVYASESAGTTDWATFDRLLAFQLNGQAEPSIDDDESSFNFCSSTSKLLNTADYEEGGSVDDGDLWSLTRSASSATDHINHGSL